MMTKLYAARLAGEGINVYEIQPGVIATDMTGAVKEKYDKLFADGLTPINRWGQSLRRGQGRGRHRAGRVSVQHGTGVRGGRRVPPAPADGSWPQKSAKNK